MRTVEHRRRQRLTPLHDGSSSLRESPPRSSPNASCPSSISTGRGHSSVRAGTASTRPRTTPGIRLINLRNRLFATLVLAVLLTYALVALAVLQPITKPAMTAAVAFFLVGAIVRGVRRALPDEQAGQGHRVRLRTRPRSAAGDAGALRDRRARRHPVHEPRRQPLDQRNDSHSGGRDGSADHSGAGRDLRPGDVHDGGSSSRRSSVLRQACS